MPAETDWLEEVLHNNGMYQIMLIPGRVTKEKGLQDKQATLQRQVYQEVFGKDGPLSNEGWIKAKIATMNKQYLAEQNKLGKTRASLLFDKIKEGTCISTQLTPTCKDFAQRNT